MLFAKDLPEESIGNSDRMILRNLGENMGQDDAPYI
jgi:hypothetical protein